MQLASSVADVFLIEGMEGLGSEAAGVQGLLAGTGQPTLFCPPPPRKVGEGRNRRGLYSVKTWVNRRGEIIDTGAMAMDGTMGHEMRFSANVCKPLQKKISLEVSGGYL